MSEIRLKPCPFCGASAAVISTVRENEMCGNFEDCPCHTANPDDCNLFFAVCSVHTGGCGAGGGVTYSREEAAANWNRRVGEI